MTPAPGRTADNASFGEEGSSEREMREALQRISALCWAALNAADVRNDVGRAICGLGSGIVQDVDYLLAEDGPLAQLQSDLAAARKERDEALKLRRDDRTWYEMTVSVVEEQRENYRAEAVQLRSRLLEAEKGAEAMGWSTDWSAAERVAFARQRRPGMRSANGQSWLAIAKHRVVGIVVEDRGRAAMDAFAEWRADPEITELVRAPDQIARRFFRQPWPGLDAAFSILAQEADCAP